jgi:hypothetical protein
MRTPDRAHPGALVVLTAATATAAVGLAALARTGAALCGHRLLVHHHDAATAMGREMAMRAAVPADGVCPILFYAAAVAASLCFLAVVVFAARPVAVALAAAFRLLVPGDGARWLAVRRQVLIPAGSRIARRRPSRAPPIPR